MAVVMGFDTSLSTTGIGRVDLEPDAAGVLRAVVWSTARAIVKGGTPADVAGERARIRRMLSRILAHVPDRVALSVVEGPAPGGKFSGKADERAGLRWFLIDQLCARGPVALVDPQTRSVLATSRGVRRRSNESVADAKARVLAAVRTLVPAAHVPNHDVADAVAITYAGAHALGMPANYTAEQISAHAKVAWPVAGGLLSAEKG